MYELKEMVKDNKKVQLTHYKNGELWYITETGFEFPVPIDDIADATFYPTDKALLFMRYIKKHIKLLEGAKLEQANLPNVEVIGNVIPVVDQE